MSLTSFFARQPVLVNSVFVAVMVIGFGVAGDLPQERYPNTPLNKVIVAVIYPGTSPEEMERTVAIPLEEKLQDLDDLEWMNTKSSEDKTLVELKFDDDIEDLEETGRIVQSKVEEVDLPEGTLEPTVIPVITDEVMPAIEVAMGGDFSNATIHDLADRLKSRILDFEDVSKVEVRGVRDREIWVEVDPARAEEYRVPLVKLDEVLALRSMSLPAGKVLLGTDEFTVRTMGEIGSVEDVMNAVVSTDDQGRITRVRDVAEVKDTFAEQRVRLRLDGTPTAFLTVFKKKGGDVVGAVDDVVRECDEFARSVPGLKLTYRNDQSISVRESFSVLLSNAALGGFLVIAFLFALMNLRGSILVLLGLPFAFAATLLVMRVVGFTLNTLALFSFIIVLGMLVDDGIVICENVFRHLEMGKDRLTAAIDGTREVAWPVFSAVSTTIAAFLPMLLMQGVLGEFLWNFPVIVSICLGASMLQAFVILPAHLSDFGPHAKDVSPRRWFAAVQGVYTRVLASIVRHRYVATAVLLVVSAVSAALVAVGIKTGYIPVEMFGEEEVSTITMNIELPVGSSLDETQAAVAEMEQRILAMKGKPVKSIVTTVGQVIDEHFYLTKSHLAALDMDLGSLEERISKGKDLEQRIRAAVEDIPGVVRVSFATFGSGPPVGKPVEIRVLGDDLVMLREHAGSVQDALRGTPGVVDVHDSLALGKEELRVIPREDDAALYGMSVAAIAITVRNALEGHVATTMRIEGGDEVDVVVKLAPEAADSVDDVRALRMMTPKGPIPLGRMADMEVGRELDEINRRDGERFANVMADVVKGVATSDSVNKEMKKRLAGFESQNPGYRIQFGGEAEEQAKSFGSLYQAFLLALFLIYIILGAQFRSFVQPLIVMTAVPFSFIGVFLGLLVMRLSFSITALISVVGLAGVVVNDALVLVDFANNMVASGRPVTEAAVEAGRVRIRAVLMTSSTTIGGLAPLAFGIGGTSELWAPMATTMCCGLAFATCLTLFMIPSFYCIVDDVRRLFGRVTRRGVRTPGVTSGI